MLYIIILLSCIVLVKNINEHNKSIFLKILYYNIVITVACIYCMHEHIMPKHTLIGCQTWYDLHGNIQP